jgi:hypothetical protein
MKHRYLNDDVGLTSAAIDDILNRDFLTDGRKLHDVSMKREKLRTAREDEY